jgi:tetratricopeptide (TPR) repeat protein
MTASTSPRSLPSPRSRRTLASRLLPPAVAAGLALALVAVIPPGSLRAATTAAAKAPAAKAAPAAAAAKDSLSDLEAAVRRDSTNAKKRYRLGVAYLDNDRPQEAARQFQKAVDSKPDYLEAWVNLGASQDAIGHGAEARSAYREALKLNPGDEIALCRLASSFYATGQKDSAMTTMRATLEKNPRSHCTYFTLGVAYADAGMFREAIRTWQRVVEYAPDSPEAESAKESIKLLQDYLGPEDSTQTAAARPGVAPGSGGPGEAIPGGAMAPQRPARGSNPKGK